MKGFAIGCGTIVLLLAAVLAYVLLTTDLEPTTAERAACDAAVAAADGGTGGTEATGGYGIRVVDGERTVRIDYGGGSGVGYACTLVDGAVRSVVRREELRPVPEREPEEQLI